MSFVDIRKCVVMMRDLGYPHPISLNSFRFQNFELVADCLQWLMLRYDPAAELVTDITTEGHRVAFLREVVQTMLSKARIKLNSKRLYSADGYAVQELLKVASLLQDATKAVSCQENDNNNVELGPSMKAFDLKAMRLLVTEITKCGASLHDILDSETSAQESRLKATMMNTDMDEIERGLKEAISTMLESISFSEQEQANVKKEEESLLAKLEKRKFEVERSEKRLSILHNVRPPYMDKYESLQKDLQNLFALYSEKFRNLRWLQSQMESRSREEHEKLEDADRRMRRVQSKLLKEELSILKGEEVHADSTGNQPSSEEESEGEGTTFWKWSDVNLFKPILGPRVNQHPPATALASAMTRGSAPGVQEWVSHIKGGGISVLGKAMPNLDFDPPVPDALNHSNTRRGESGLKSPHSMDGTDSSAALEECDDELLDTDGIDPKGTGEDESSDDNF